MVIEFDVDDAIGELIQNEAKRLNLSTDDYIKYIIIEEINKINQAKAWKNPPRGGVIYLHEPRS